MQRRTLRDGPSIDQDECEDNVEQTQCGELIRSAPGDDAAIVARHVVVVIIVVRALHELFFEETFVGQRGLFDDGWVQSRAEDVRLGACRSG